MTKALEGEKGREWANAMEAELQGVWENQVFEEVPMPAGKKVIC